MAYSDRLDSWKEIASYIRRDISTCMKWEKELKLPIFRVNKKSPRSPVFAFKSDIDNWFKNMTKG